MIVPHEESLKISHVVASEFCTDLRRAESFGKPQWNGSSDSSVVGYLYASRYSEHQHVMDI